MPEKEDPDAYRHEDYVCRRRIEMNSKGERKERFDLEYFVGEGKDRENKTGPSCDTPEEVARLFARVLLEQGRGRFKFDSVTLTLCDANPHGMPRELYEHLLNSSPGMTVNRGAAGIHAYGEQRELLEGIAQETWRLLENTLGKENFRGLAATAPGEYNHNLYPTRIPASVR